MSYKQKALNCFQDGFNCAQAVLSTYAPQFNLDKEMALRVAGGFGGGMGSMGETCGAVTGAIMVIGLKYGKTKKEDKEAKWKTYKMVQEFTKRFTDKYSSIKCRGLLGCDLSTPEGNELAKEKNLFKTLCPLFIEEAIDILNDIISEEKAE